MNGRCCLVSADHVNDCGHGDGDDPDMWSSALVLLGLVAGDAVAADAPWWKDAVYYRLLVDSFKDYDGDGLGDVSGATKQLSYIKALGADAILLSPVYSKSTDCNKPGLLDPTDLDIRYGTLAQFTGLLDKAKKLDLKVVLELPLQTISAASEWFGASANRSTGFDDWLLWRDGDSGQVPETEPGVESWNYYEDRKGYWAAKENEAILNICSEGLKTTLSAAQCAWIRRGVTGVMLAPDFPKDQTCAEQLVRHLAAGAAHCARSANLDIPVIIVDTSMEPEKATKYYGAGGGGASTVLSKAMTSADRMTAPELALKIHAAVLHTPNEFKPTWITSRSGESRVATRYGSDLVDAINLLTLVLPGSAVVQQGDELGGADTLLEWAADGPAHCWPSPARPSSAPFPWDDSTNGGFSAGLPWLPLAMNYKYANAKTEFASESSHAGAVRVASAMRKSPAIGPHIEITRLGDALAILRWGGAGSLLVISNLGRESTEAHIQNIPGLPNELTVAASSSGSSFNIGDHVAVDKALKLIPGETILMAGAPRHCGGPGPVDKIASKLSEGWQKINKYFSN